MFLPLSVTPGSQELTSDLRDLRVDLPTILFCGNSRGGTNGDCQCLWDPWPGRLHLGQGSCEWACRPWAYRMKMVSKIGGGPRCSVFLCVRGLPHTSAPILGHRACVPCGRGGRRSCGCWASKGTKNTVRLSPGLYPSIKLMKHGTRLKPLYLVSLPANPDPQPLPCQTKTRLVLLRQISNISFPH